MLGRRQTIVLGAALLALFLAAVLLQIERERRYPLAEPAGQLLYVPSGTALKRMTVAYAALAADLYWIRAIQHYGGTRRAAGGDKTYPLLFPLLDITTALDPRFNIAYRFGAIFLAEASPGGPGRPDLAIVLLEKGLRERPERWHYMQDIGFVHYWWRHDYKAAADWFLKASQVSGAPWWLRSLAANTLAQGGDRASSRLMWQKLYETAEIDWLRKDAERRLTQLLALDQIDRLQEVVVLFTARRGATPGSWRALVAAGLLPGLPVDPSGVPYVLDPATGRVTLSNRSPLFPLPVEPNRIVTPST